ncbi:hypothetical protein [Winogradskyella sediminis]|uniref:Uncharacterized protein n=1 Tax=Winogradskyella sediminis TaxID=1382466 RepID=A0A1H1X7Y1_9FLAO|nr:hypothetical protein [Winogradskyella sediminis]SDT05161.1 hypothetical protein SAMN04489797_3123 [Winogradskyella sediminis]|tara:strand:- start:838 stop:1482 length:645 start_codon:yes stop_codon:yes gene_type:complete
MRNTLINRTFNTPLGIISCDLNSNYTFIELQNSGSYKNGTYEKFKTSAHDIELIEFKVKQPFYNGETIADSKCWIWRIEKVKEIFEDLEIKVLITDFPKNSEFDFASGENLDAFEITNDKWKLHIGTEDGEILNYRAENNDWFPTRLLNKKNHWQEITELNKSSILTNVPELKIGEKIHLQYLTAFDKQNTETINTWVAIDEHKSELEKWIGIK